MENQEINLVQYCYERLERDIIHNILAPGEKLSMHELKKRLGAGQSPIREALSLLVTSGLVEAQFNKGFYVAKVSEEAIRDIYRTFNQIENLALQQAMTLGDDRWQAQIVAALYELSLVETKDKSVEQEEWFKRNYAFHAALIAGCNSPVLLRLRHAVHQHFERYCRMSFGVIKNSLDCNHKAHKKLAEAVLQRDIPLATQLMTQHISGGLEAVITALKKNKLV